MSQTALIVGTTRSHCHVAVPAGMARMSISKVRRRVRDGSVVRVERLAFIQSHDADKERHQRERETQFPVVLCGLLSNGFGC